MIKIQHSFVVPEYVAEVNEDIKKSWLLYYLRAHTIENSTAACKQFIYDTDIKNIISKFINNPEDDTEYLIISWFGVYASNFWNVHKHIIDDIIYCQKNNHNWIIKGNPNNKDIITINLKEIKKFPNLSIERLFLAAEKYDPSFENHYINTNANQDITLWNDILKMYTNLDILPSNMSKFISQLVSTRNFTHSIPEDDGVFFFSNTEKICPDFNFLETQKSINTIITPCSMFKAFILGEKYVQAKNYVHFDIFARNILIKETFTNFWNGEYKTLHDTLINCIPNENALWHKGSISEMVNNEWYKLLEHFQTEKNIKKSWKNYKEKNHQYTQANLLFNDDNIISCLENIDVTGIYHCIGDIPGFRSNALQFGIKNITSYTIKHLEKIENINNNLIVDIKMVASDKQQVDFSSDIKSMFEYEQQYYKILSE